jgi:hypothetical protein
MTELGSGPASLAVGPTGPLTEPYLSVVVTTRNDDHGGDPLKRLQAFVNCFDEQCRRTGLDAEVIVVEWNPPPERPSVGSLLRLPVPSSCTYRFLEVPPELHNRLQYADVLPLFQMIAKNVGVRRAHGRFVLATNIDIIFSTELIEYIASRRLQTGSLYRVDRHDITSDFPVDAPLDEQLSYCESHQLRVHRRQGSYPVDRNGAPVCLPEDIVDGSSVRLGDGWHVRESAGPGRAFRWATRAAELVLEPRAAGLSRGDTVLELEVESNPYHRGSSIEIAVVENDRTLVTTYVQGHVSFEVPLDASQRTRRLELRVTEEHQTLRSQLPMFEHRGGMEYRVYRAQLRRADVTAFPGFVYPEAGWSSAYPHSGVILNDMDDGLHVTSDARRFSYCIQYGPLRVPQRGTYRFEVCCTLIEGGVAIGVLSGDRQSWIPSRIKHNQDRASQHRGARRLEVEVDLLADTPCWLMISNDHPDGDGVSSFIVRETKGSEDPERLQPRDPAPLRKRSVANLFAIAYAKAARWARRNPQDGSSRLRAYLSKLADSVARWIVEALGPRQSYRLVHSTREFQEMQRELRESVTELRELQTLKDLSDFSQFLRVRRPDNLHLNGCGDFQLMAREHWDELRGYAEFETFSMNIDGLFSYTADAAGIKEQYLPMPIFHLEHEVGSGWSPEGEALLRRRIAERGITWLDASTVHIWAAYMTWLRRPMIFNGANWGMASAQLAERTDASVCRAT